MLNRFPKVKRIEILIKWTLFVHNEEGGGLSGTLATSFENDTMYGGTQVRFAELRSSRLSIVVDYKIIFDGDQIARCFHELCYYQQY